MSRQLAQQLPAGSRVTGATTRTDAPPPNDEGLVVRPLGTVEVVPTPATVGTLTPIAVSALPVVLLAANPARLGFSIRNSSTADTLYVLAGAGVPAVGLHTVALVPGAYYEDPYHYVGEVTGVWNAATNGFAMVDEYT